jgi:hypothetical protein
LNRIATVISVLTLIEFYGKSLSGTIAAFAVLALSLWSSHRISSIAAREGADLLCHACVNSVPSWLEWLSFGSFAASCGLGVWAVLL